ARVRWRRCHGARRGARARLHERPRADRRRAARWPIVAGHARRVRRSLSRRARLEADVAMTAPWIEDTAGGALVPAVAIGAAFGASLEGAGLGSARKLVGQFYGTDLTVLKVMFSAIVVAMLGAFWLGRLGVLELSRVEVPGTWLVP